MKFKKKKKIFFFFFFSLVYRSYDYGISVVNTKMFINKKLDKG